MIKGIRKICMDTRKKIVLVAHDNKKPDLLEWARFNKELLARHTLFATGTTGALLQKELALDVEQRPPGRRSADRSEDNRGGD